MKQGYQHDSMWVRTGARTSRLLRPTAILWVTAAVSFSACTYKRPETQTPAPHPMNVQKSFFVVDDGGYAHNNLRSGDGGARPPAPAFHSAISAADPASFQNRRTFLCGWAPITAMGELSERYAMIARARAEHCNIQFEFTENALVGKVINPSFRNDPSKWEIGITIGVDSHFYTERERDDRGRERNRIIENTQRSEWRLRPEARLNFNRVEIRSSAFQFLALDPTVIGVEDIDWDRERGFLGFTVVMGDRALQSHLQTRYRMNFMAFQHNPQLVKTPFQLQNFRHINVLHVLGESIQGVHDSYFAAKWDIRKSQPIYLFNFPNEIARNVARDVVEDWNKTFQKIGAVPAGFKPFYIAPQPARRPFDLRQNTFVWVDDRRTNQNSPLGFAQVHADIRSGEILWGSAVLFASQLEDYVMRYSPALAAGAPPAGRFARMVSSLETSTLQPLQAVQRQLLSSLDSLVGSLNVNFLLLPSGRGDFGRSASVSGDGLQAFQSQVAAQMGGLRAQSFSQRGDVGPLTDAIRQRLLGDPRAQILSEAERRLVEFERRHTHHNTACSERTFASVHHAFGQLAVASENMNLQELYKVFLKELISHEYGHFLNEGHQFMENIVPAPGTVPDSIQVQLAQQAVEGKNRTSIMGYPHPMTMMKLKYEETTPEIQDELVLRYIYKREIPVIRPNGSGEVGDFEYVALPADGLIPDSQLPDGRKVAYMPQCNDINASYSDNPLCNRHDMGSNATEIAQYYMDDLNDRLRTILTNFTDASSADAATWGLMYSSYSHIGRLRLFYDHMRRTHRDALREVARSQETLIDFSRACQMQDSELAEAGGSSLRKLGEIFTANPGLKELCAVNAKIVTQLGEWIGHEASDFTRFDHERSYGFFGSRDGTRLSIGGRRAPWRELGVLPLKIPAIEALETPVPWTLGFYGLEPVPTFDTPDARYVYSSFYPVEYTRAISTMLERNLRFATLNPEQRTGMDLSVYFQSLLASRMASMSNDASQLPPQFIAQVRSQAAFNVSVVALLVEGKEREGRPGKVDVFSGQIFDLQSGRTLPLSSVYLLPGGTVLAQAESTFVFPFPRAQLRFYEDRKAFILAFRVDYQIDPDDELSGSSAKTSLQSAYNRVYNACVIDSRTESTPPSAPANGLASFFNTETDRGFDGFDVQNGIARDNNKYNQFLRSVRDSFARYRSAARFSANPPQAQTCDEALVGLNTITSAAALMNGYALPELADRFLK